MTFNSHLAQNDDNQPNGVGSDHFFNYRTIKLMRLFFVILLTAAAAYSRAKAVREGQVYIETVCILSLNDVLTLVMKVVSNGRPTCHWNRKLYRDVML